MYLFVLGAFMTCESNVVLDQETSASIEIKLYSFRPQEYIVVPFMLDDEAWPMWQVFSLPHCALSSSVGFLLHYSDRYGATTLFPEIPVYMCVCVCVCGGVTSNIYLKLTHSTGYILYLLHHC